MAIGKGFRFPIEFKTAFPQGLVQMGDITPAIKYNADRTALPEQDFDFDPKNPGVGTQLHMWKVTVSDPNQDKAKRASFEIIFTAEVQPVPVNEELVPGMGMRLIELEGLTAEPKVMGQAPYQYLGYIFRATGIKGDTSGAKIPPVDVPASRPARGEKAGA
ncbi:hypothetical protein ACFRAQ_02715 [Nocardia sp. NPDC056611]|uniref:hypothetical protein n=1 Tax=Nocardia sp. NPDC056611 TaxID=3345877 RepID=UPI00366F1320